MTRSTLTRAPRPCSRNPGRRRGRSPAGGGHERRVVHTTTPATGPPGHPVAAVTHARRDAVEHTRRHAEPGDTRGRANEPGEDVGGRANEPGEDVFGHDDAAAQGDNAPATGRRQLRARPRRLG